MDRAAREAERRKRIFNYVEQTGNVAKAGRYFGIGRASFYRWRERYQNLGEPGLNPKKSG